MRDFFISYTGADEAWAEWIAWTLEEEAGYTVTLQKWDFRAGSNFVLEMERATKEAKRTIAVLSPDYLNSRFGAPEWAAAFAKDPEGMKRTLVPVRVRECDVEGLRKPIVYIDVVGLDEAAARRKLLADLKPGRGKPASKPAFPGPAAPAFPRSSDKPGAGSSAAVGAPRPRYMPAIRGTITDRDRRQFAKEAFSTIREHFDHALAELAAQHAGVEIDLSRVDATTFIAEIFVNGESRARCKIWHGGMLGGDSISYAEGSAVDQGNAYNECLTLSEQRGGLGLHATMSIGIGKATEGLEPGHLSPEDAGEYLWRRFVLGLAQ